MEKANQIKKERLKSWNRCRISVRQSRTTTSKPDDFNKTLKTCNWRNNILIWLASLEAEFSFFSLSEKYRSISLLSIKCAFDEIKPVIRIFKRVVDFFLQVISIIVSISFTKKKVKAINFKFVARSSVEKKKKTLIKR